MGTVEDLTELRAYVNRHSVRSAAAPNAVNSTNDRYYEAALDGLTPSPAVSYLLNLTDMTLKDYRSIGAYNAMNIAASIAANRAMEEIENSLTVHLPEPRSFRTRLSRAIDERRSVRTFADSLVSASALSSWIFWSLGLTTRQQTFRDVRVPARAYASGGGLYPITTWFLIDRVSDMSCGVYRYQPYSHTLYPRLGEEHDLETLFPGGAFDLAHAGGAVLYELDLDRVLMKYGDLSLLTGLVELGNMTHSRERNGLPCGIGSCQVAGFDKAYAQDLLGLDGVNSHVVFTQVFGRRG